MQKINSGLFKNVICKMCLESYIYMYKKDLALNNLQWLICHKTQPNQGTKQIFSFKEALDSCKFPTQPMDSDSACAIFD